MRQEGLGKLKNIHSHHEASNPLLSACSIVLRVPVTLSTIKVFHMRKCVRITSPASRRRRRKGETCAWGHNWTTLLLGDINTVTWSVKLGLDTRLTNLA
jgi:hypothetical protein